MDGKVADFYAGTMLLSRKSEIINARCLASRLLCGFALTISRRHQKEGRCGPFLSGPLGKKTQSNIVALPNGFDLLFRDKRRIILDFSVNVSMTVIFPSTMPPFPGVTLT